jgi:hypothetical protein
MVGTLLDTVLDRTILGGYTNLGYRLRSRWWEDADLASMDGKVVLVTGASSGLGRAAAAGFAALGASSPPVCWARCAGAPGRVINVSSGGMYAQRLKADDLQSEQEDFDSAAASARSKRAEVVLNEMWPSGCPEARSWCTPCTRVLADRMPSSS